MKSRRHPTAVAVALAASALLAACGGGTSDGGTPTVSETSTQPLFGASELSLLQSLTLDDPNRAELYGESVSFDSRFVGPPVEITDAEYRRRRAQDRRGKSCVTFSGTQPTNGSIVLKILRTKPT